MNVYKEDPDCALATLQKIADEIPSGVSSQDVATVISAISEYPNEIGDNLRETIAEDLKRNIAVLWKSHNVCEKLKMIKRLKCSDLAAKRVPMTLSEAMTTLAAKQLKKRKEELQSRIKKIKDDNLQIENCLRTKNNLFEQQILKMIKDT